MLALVRPSRPTHRYFRNAGHRRRGSPKGVLDSRSSHHAGHCPGNRYHHPLAHPRNHAGPANGQARPHAWNGPGCGSCHAELAGAPVGRSATSVHGVHDCLTISAKQAKFAGFAQFAGRSRGVVPIVLLEQPGSCGRSARAGSIAQQGNRAGLPECPYAPCLCSRKPGWPGVSPVFSCARYLSTASPTSTQLTRTKPPTHH